jgi:hypothetical protein
MNLEGHISMKTSIKLALAVVGAAGIAAMPLAAFADDATPEGGNNCSNMRTTTNSRCVHYNEKAHDGWANQQGQKTVTWSTSGKDHATGNPYTGHRYSDGSGDFQETNIKTGITSVTIHNANGSFSTLTTHSGGGGSGGSHGGTSAK